MMRKLFPLVNQFHRKLLTSRALWDSLCIQMMAWSEIALQDRTMCSNLPSTGTAVLTTGGNLPILQVASIHGYPVVWSLIHLARAHITQFDSTNEIALTQLYNNWLESNISFSLQNYYSFAWFLMEDLKYMCFNLTRANDTSHASA